MRKQLINSVLPRYFVWVLLCMLITLQGCSSRDSELEYALVEKIIQHKTDKVESIDLREILGVNWEKVCIQHPYMFQEKFEKEVGMKVSQYEAIPDDRYVIWVFYGDMEPNQLAIKRVKIMDYRGWGSRCTSRQQPYLYFEMHEGEKNISLTIWEVLNDERIRNHGLLMSIEPSRKRAQQNAP